MWGLYGFNGRIVGAEMLMQDISKPHSMYSSHLSEETLAKADDAYLALVKLSMSLNEDIERVKNEPKESFASMERKSKQQVPTI